MELVLEDLNKPQVVKLVEQACSDFNNRRYIQDFLQELLEMLGPSKSARRGRKVFSEMMEAARQARAQQAKASA